MQFRKDYWRPGIVDAPMDFILQRGTLADLPVRWLPLPPAGCFHADPFALWRDEHLHVFVEAFDYRVRVGTIEVLVFDRALRLIDHGPVLSEPWHLSYPYLVEWEGETWMLPEAHMSRALRLYRAVDFPFRWETAAVLQMDQVTIDPTVIHHGGLWWMFSAAGRTVAEADGRLSIHFADRLTGPWHPHPHNPVHISQRGGRPGGSARIIDGQLMVPLQDCTRTYGGSVLPLWFDALTPDRFSARMGAPLEPLPGYAPYNRGLHTISAAGDRTLIDVKRITMTPHTLAMDVRYKLGQWLHGGAEAPAGAPGAVGHARLR